MDKIRMASIACWAAFAVGCPLVSSAATDGYDWNGIPNGVISDLDVSWTKKSISGSDKVFYFDRQGEQSATLTNDFTNTAHINVGNDADVTLDLDGHTWSLGGKNVRLPDSTAGDAAVTLKSGSVSAGGLYMGYTTNGKGGTINITGANSVFTVANDSNLAYRAPGSVMRVEAGARFETNGLLTDNGTAANGESELHVTDGGSVYVAGKSKDISVAFGQSSSSNLLEIAGAGSALTNAAQFRVGLTEGACRNSIVVRDGAILCQKTSGKALIIGVAGSSNSLLAKGGAQCAIQKIYIGACDSASSNTVTVAGAGTRMTMPGGIDVGLGGNYNALCVTNGAFLKASGSLTMNSGQKAASGSSVGAAPSFGNRITVSGEGSYVEAAQLYVGRTNGLAKVEVSSGAGLYVSAGSTTFSYIGENPTASDNEISVFDGGVVTNTTKFIVGNATGTARNRIFISGDGAAWRQRGTSAYFRIGANGVSNELTVVKGGTFSAQRDVSVGYEARSCDNFAHISGEGSVLTNTSVVHVGYKGSRNRLLVDDNGVAYALKFSIGAQSGSDSNSVVVANGAVLSCGGEGMYVGTSGADGNQLIVSNAAFRSTGTASMTNSAQMVLSGATAEARLPRLNVYEGSVLKFVADRQGLPSFVTREAGTVKAKNAGIYDYSSSGCRIEIDATKCRTRGDFEVIDCAIAVPEKLRNNVSVQGPATCSWSSDYKKLTVSVKPETGMAIILR